MLGVHSSILMSDGTYKPIIDIHYNDLIHSFGEDKVVEWVINRGRKRVIGIELYTDSGVFSLDATEDQLIATAKGDIPLRNLSVGDMIYVHKENLIGVGAIVKKIIAVLEETEVYEITFGGTRFVVDNVVFANPK